MCCFTQSIHTLRLSGRTHGRTHGRTDGKYLLNIQGFRDKLLLLGEHGLTQRIVWVILLTHICDFLPNRKK
jgi:hypothetical protein